jgi:TonB-dependent SusC/RagA subfamily outer membrane receptor
MKRILTFALFFICCSSGLYAQGLIVSGKVIDDSSQTGIQGVSVVVTETRQGVSTDADGNFRIVVSGNRSTVSLRLSYVGYRQQTITGVGATAVTIQLVKEQSNLDDVVVIGYQTVRRKDVLASVASVGAKELKDIPINSAAEALNGRLAGVTATTSEGSPDASVRIRVRGGMSITQNNDPLYIIDGVQVENGLNSISPQDIQSIDVLKDAAATAIYGARGANGVVVITTKTGRPGRLIVSYNGFGGIRYLPKPLTFYRLMSMWYINQKDQEEAVQTVPHL